MDHLVLNFSKLQKSILLHRMTNNYFFSCICELICNLSFSFNIRLINCRRRRWIDGKSIFNSIEKCFLHVDRRCKICTRFCIFMKYWQHKSMFCLSFYVNAIYVTITNLYHEFILQLRYKIFISSFFWTLKRNLHILEYIYTIQY